MNRHQASYVDLFHNLIRHPSILPSSVHAHTLSTTLKSSHLMVYEYTGPSESTEYANEKIQFPLALCCVVDIDVDNVFDSFLGNLEDHKLDLGVHVPIA